jgi:hypothetical protein
MQLKEMGISTQSGTERWAQHIYTAQVQGGGAQQLYAAHEVDLSSLGSSCTERWAQQLYAAQVQGGGHSSSM